ncbi:MAG: glycosylase [Saccharothrix sp.]|nr:glycosylase [Saccharothrix sp.]
MVPFAPASASAAAEASGGRAAGVLKAFPLSDVALGEGVFAAKSKLMLDFLRGYDVDRLLQVFRANAGLPTLGAVAPGGWEGLDGEANGNLRGHFTGHFLTALAQAYGSTGDEAYAEKIRYAVGALVEVREALRRDPTPRRVPGRFGTAVENPRGSYQIFDLPPTVLANSPAITISAWVKPEHDSRWARVFDFGNDVSRYLFLTPRSHLDRPRFAITPDGPGVEQVIDGAEPLPVGRWSHLAVTIEGTTGSLYVNGTRVGVNTAMTHNPATLGPLRNHWLGNSQFPADPTFAGAFDQVDLWSRALGADEIAALQHTPARGDLASYSFDETTGSTITDASGRGQHATFRRNWGGPSHPGFLAAYPETQFITLESMTAGNYFVVWAPYYTAHKILRGLLDAHANTGDERALDLAAGLGDWMHSRLSKLPEATLQRMWGIFSSGEFGGIVEAVCDLHARTGKAEHLALARLFDLDRLIDSCAAGVDILDGLHANQHIPILTGLVRLYEETGEQRYLDAARNFWGMVTPTRMYSIGGTSTAEFWRAAGHVAGTLSDTNAETCCAHNMLKLSRSLFRHDRDPRYADYYERALLNQVLGSKQDKADAEKPLVTYFIGLVPGHVRDYTPKQGTTCCEGTGMESATKYQDSIYFADEDELYVNLYSASTLKWADKGVTVTQRTAYPVEQGATLTVRGGAAFTLRLRVPAWAHEFHVEVNGREVEREAVPGTYFALTRTWRDGDVVRVSIPFRVRVERALDDPRTQSLFYGPVNLVARDPRTTFLELALYRDAGLSGDLRPSLAPVPGEPLRFTLDGLALAPFFEGTEDPTHVYFHRSEPTVAFGGTDSGVANPSRNGTTFLDDVWAAAPFHGKGNLLRHVRATADAYVAEGLLTSDEAERVVRTAQRASYAK